MKLTNTPFVGISYGMKRLLSLFIGPRLVSKSLLYYVTNTPFPPIGTALGATVAAMFPDRIDKMILDGVVNPHLYYHGKA